MKSHKIKSTEISKTSFLIPISENYYQQTKSENVAIV